MYFRKSLDESSVHLNRITGVIVNGYLFPEISDSGLKVDIIHAEKILKLLENYLPAYFKYISAYEATDALQEWTSIKEKLSKGYG